jgi:hypothetical protein
MLVTASPRRIEQVFVSLGVRVTGSEPPTDAVMPMDEAVRLFAGYGAAVLGPRSRSATSPSFELGRRICTAGAGRAQDSPGSIGGDALPLLQRLGSTTLHPDRLLG